MPTVAGRACVLLLALACTACDRGASVTTGPHLTAQVGRALDARLTQEAASGLAGVTAAVVFPDGREWSGAVGEAVLDPSQPMTARTAMPFDSITKLATAALALRLAERGRLRLDTPIRRWYPAWRGDPRVTVRDLLGHTAGARDPPQAFFTRLLRHPRRTSTARRFLAAAPKPGPRSRQTRYSNAGFVIAGLVLQRAARVPLAVAMRRELFGHPGGGGLAFQPAEQAHPPRAHSYGFAGGLSPPVDTSDGEAILPFGAIAGAIGAAGALAGDVPSLARWADELFGGRIVTRRSLRAMSRFHPGGPWPAYGLGLARRSIDGHDAWGHTGAGFGSHSEVWHLPRDGLTVAVAWNRDAIDADARLLPALVRAALPVVPR